MATLPASSSPPPRRILVVEADPARALALALALGSDTTAVIVARSHAAVLGALEATGRQPDAAVISWCGGAVWTRGAFDAVLAARQPCAALVLVDDPVDADVLIADGHNEVLLMPAAPDVIAVAVRRVIATTARIRVVLGQLPRRARRLRRQSRDVVRGRAELNPPSSPPLASPAPELNAAAAPVAAPESSPTVALRWTFERAVEMFARQTALSRRERSVFRLIAMGCAYPEIGRELSISARTVKMHAASVRLKTGADSRSALVRTFFAS